ncbi:MAG: YfhO family protein [Planctomycetota bacterium]
MAPGPRLLSREALLALAGAMLLSMAWFFPAWFEGRSQYSTDLVLAKEPWKSELGRAEGHPQNAQLGDLDAYFFPQLAFAVRERHERGAWPLWNPEIYAGTSLIGNPQVPLWNPFVRVLPWFQEAGAPFSPWRLALGLTWTGILRFVLCGAFAYLWLRRLGGHPLAAAAGALFVCAGPYASLWRFSTPEQVLSLMPMALSLLEGLRRGWHGPSVVGLALGWGLSCLGGYPQTSLILGLFLLVYWWSRTAAGTRRAPFLAAGTGLLLGTLLALPCWLPFVQFLGEASVGALRAAAAAAANRSATVGSEVLVVAIVLGAVGALLAPDTSRLRKGALGLLGASLLVTLLLEDGWRSSVVPLSTLPTDYVPGSVNSIEAGQCSLGFALLPVFLFVGLARRNLGTLCAIVLVLQLGTGSELCGLPVRNMLPLVDPTRFAVLLPLLVAIGLLPAWEGLRRLGLRELWLRIAIVPALAIALLPGIGWLPTLGPEDCYPSTTTIETLEHERASTPGFRLLVVDKDLLPVNAPLVYDLPLMLGADGMDPEHMVFLLVHLLPEGSYGLPRPDWTAGFLRLDLPLVDNLGVTHVLAPAGTARPAGFSEVSATGAVVLWRNDEAAPRAELLAEARSFEADRYGLLTMAPDAAVVLFGTPPPLPGPAMGTGSVRVAESGPDRLVLATEADGAAWLLLRAAWLPGWHATVDGAPVEVLRADFAFMGLALPAGGHEVVLHYRPWTYDLGLWAAGLSLFVLGCLLGFEARRALSRRSGSPAPAAGPDPS